MKANKIFAVALAALTLVSFNACNKKEEPKPDPEGTLALDPTSVQLKVGETATITATVEATWTSSDAEVATVAPGNDGGKTALVTAVKEGSAVISATTKGGQTKTCIVAVKKGGDTPQSVELKGSQVWPIVLDGTTADANASKIVADFRPNDVDQFLYNWQVEGGEDLTYSDGEASGLNFHGNSDGYVAWLVGRFGWAGAGLNIKSQVGIEAAEALRQAIIANPDDYYLHLAMKSTDNYAHCFYFMDNEGTKFVIGSHTVYDGPVYQDFVRDGAWHEFDIPLASYATALGNKSVTGALNVFVMLSEGTQGAQLNLDAVYFYKK